METSNKASSSRLMFYSSVQSVMNEVLSDVDEEPSKSRCGKRHIVALWVFFGLTIDYMLRCSINIAIVAMAHTPDEISGSGSSYDHSINGTCPRHPEGMESHLNSSSSMTQTVFFNLQIVYGSNLLTYFSGR